VSFRRVRQQANDEANWRRFLQANGDLLARAGVPPSIAASRALWDDLLMHGYIHHHLDPTHFSVRLLDSAQQAYLEEAIVRYFRAGFPDPGLSLFGLDRLAAMRLRATEDE
jgi:hypothetical protein